MYMCVYEPGSHESAARDFGVHIARIIPTYKEDRAVLVYDFALMDECVMSILVSNNPIAFYT
jgi:hypothetical protein